MKDIDKLLNKLERKIKKSKNADEQLKLATILLEIKKIQIKLNKKFNK